MTKNTAQFASLCLQINLNLLLRTLEISDLLNYEGLIFAQSPTPGNSTRSKLLGLNDDWLVIIPQGVHESSVEFIIVNL